jgi:ribosomal protein L7/L12
MGDGVEQVDVVLDDVGDRRILVSKLVQRVTFMGSKQALDLVMVTPRVVIPAIARAEAEALTVEFRALGATVHLQPAGVPDETPLR